MNLLTFILLVPLVYFIPDFLAAWLPDNKLLNVISAVAVMVPTLSYILMPLTLKALTKITQGAAGITAQQSRKKLVP